MKEIHKLLTGLFILAGLLGCSDFDNDVDDIVVSEGTANFSTYVALGNSLTAGMQDGALYISSQKDAYPAMIAQSMGSLLTSEFSTPLMSDDLGGIPQAGLSNKLELKVVNGSYAPLVAEGAATTTLDNIYGEGPYYNLGVPGAKTVHLLAPEYGNIAGLATRTANPYFVRFASSPTTRVIDDALALNPTFFTLWIGNNDVLGYATSGADGSDLITSPSEFTAYYTALVDAITGNDAKGAIANIPYITSIPFFTTVAWNAIEFEDTEEDKAIIAQLNAAYAAYNAGLDNISPGGITIKEAERRKIKFEVGKNGLVIMDKDLVDVTSFDPRLISMRQATEKDLILLSAATPISQEQAGTATPLCDSLALTEIESEDLDSIVTVYNETIENLANTRNLALFDANAIMEQLASTNGLSVDGVRYTSDFITGGAFSLDGVHPNSRGYAIIANGFIQAINDTYGSNLPQVEVNSYKGIEFP